MRACRTCLTRKDLNPLFGDLSAYRFTSKQLYLATGVHIHPNDDLPQEACRECIKQIKKTLNFHSISGKSNEYLKQMLNKTDANNTDPTDDEYFDKYFENPDLDMFEEVKIEFDHGQSHSDNNINANSQFNKIDPDIKHEDDFDYQIIYTSSKSQSYNEINYLDNKESDSDQHCNNQADNEHNYTDSDKNHLDNHSSQPDNKSTIDNKHYLDRTNTKTHIKQAIRQSAKNVTSETRKMTGNKKQLFHRTSNQKINVKIQDLCDSVIRSENSTKARHTQLMSLAVTPYPREGPVQCRVCHEYVKRESFKRHAKRHFAPEFACEDCGKMFHSRNHMRYHQQRLHGRKKRLACSLCDYRCVDRWQMKNHERLVHSGEKPYVCNECGAAFRMRINIAQHMRTHFGVKHVQCEKCAKMFRSGSELANHNYRTHNYNIVYLCYLCPQTYKGTKAVRRHLVNLHGVREDQILKIKRKKLAKIQA